MKRFLIFLFASVLLVGCEQKPSWHFVLTIEDETQMEEVVNRVRSLDLGAFAVTDSSESQYAFDSGFILEGKEAKQAFGDKSDFRLAEVMEIGSIYQFLPDEYQDSITLMVENGISYIGFVNENVESSIRELLFLRDQDGELPFVFYSELDNEKYKIGLISKTKQEYLGDHVSRVSLSLNYNNEPWLSLYFDPSGVEAMHKITKDNVGKPLAFILYNNVVMVPVINKKIKGEVLPLANENANKLVFSRLFFGDLYHTDKVELSVIKY